MPRQSEPSSRARASKKGEPKSEMAAYERQQIRRAVADLDAPHGQPKVPGIETQEQRIRERAYQIWCDEGKPEGRREEHWHRAREEIEAELASKPPPG